MLGNIGLSLDVIGFLLMLLFNPRLKILEDHLDELVRTGQSTLTIPDYSAGEIKSIKQKLVLHKFGIILIITGFALQLLGSLFPSPYEWMSM